MVRVPSRGNSTTLLQRPVQLLHPLEILCDFSEGQKRGADSCETESQSVSAAPLRHSRRAAARNARDRVVACLYELSSDSEDQIVDADASS